MNHKISTESNSNISVHRGDTIEIQLEETPTAGYSWEIDNMDTNIFELKSSAYKIYNEGGTGGSGMRTMVFLVDGQGNGKIKLKNSQRWSGDVYRKVELSVNAD